MASTPKSSGRSAHSMIGMPMVARVSECAPDPVADQVGASLKTRNAMAAAVPARRSRRPNEPKRRSTAA